MKRLYLVALLGIGVLALAGCRGGGGLGGNPEVVEKVATNQGADLKLTWKSVEGADGYRVYCDGNKIWEGKDTTYTISGSSNVCKRVEVSAYSGSDENKTEIDLMPKSSTITGLVSHDGTGNSWVKLDLPNGSASSVRQTDVDRTATNIGWFVFFNAGGGTLQFKDASATSVGNADMEVAFTDNISSGFLAPGTGSYNTVRNVSSGGRYFFWADKRDSGYDSMDNSDYFGVIKVTSLTGTGPYRADLEIYIQNKVKGLRWVKF
jgi:predicted Rdx family selenoprotein